MIFRANETVLYCSVKSSLTKLSHEKGWSGEMQYLTVFLVKDISTVW